MPRKRIALQRTEVLVPANLDLADLSKRSGYKVDIIAVLLHQLCVVIDKLQAADGWVPLKSAVLQSFYRRPTSVLNQLELHGVIEVERNERGNKSYLSESYAKRMGVPPSSTRYRLRPDYHGDFIYHTLTERTAWKGFHRGVRRIEKEGHSLRKALEVQNVQDELYLSTNKQELERIDIKEIVNTSLKDGRFVPDSSKDGDAKPQPTKSTSDLQKAFFSNLARRSAVTTGVIVENNQSVSPYISDVFCDAIPISVPCSSATQQLQPRQPDVGRSVTDGWLEQETRRLTGIAQRYPSMGMLVGARTREEINPEDYAILREWFALEGIG